MTNNVLIITSSPTIAGNGDAIAATAEHELSSLAANVLHLNLRDFDIAPIAPICYNNLESRLITAIDRLYYPIALRDGYQRGPKKQLGVILTCEGSDPSWLNLLVERTLTKSLRASVTDWRTVVFDRCPPLHGCPLPDDYRRQTVALADWWLSARISSASAASDRRARGLVPWIMRRLSAHHHRLAWLRRRPYRRRTL